jgi:hypothetical protein
MVAMQRQAIAPPANRRWVANPAEVIPVVLATQEVTPMVAVNRFAGPSHHGH